MPSKSAQKKRGWQDAQSKAKLRKRTKLALGVLVLVFGLIIVSWTIRFSQSLFNTKKAYIWNGQFNINLMVRTNRISLLSYNPKEEKIVILNIPDETFLEIPGGFGRWQLRSVYGLGASQSTNGNQLLVRTLTDFLAIPVDGFLDFSALKPPKSAAELLEISRKNPLSGTNLLSYLKTDLTTWELIKLKLGIVGVRFDKINELNLDQLKILDRENLLDGTAVLTTDPIKLDTVLSDLADPTVTQEHKSIAVFNATEVPQLAQKWARLITNLGGNVIIMANARERLEKTQLFGEASPTLTRLQQIFGISDKIIPVEELVSRAQINLFLGEDYVW